MSNTHLAILLFFVALVATSGAYPLVLRFAIRHGIYDNPNARKLQRVPVPVMGGVAVFIGIAVTLLVASFFLDYVPQWTALVAMTVMMLIGALDDAREVPATLRFILELALVWALMYVTKTGIDDLHGLWGLGEIDPLLALPLTVVAGVGIINATNLIDGVDGYSSGYGIMASLVFSVVFFYVGAVEEGCLAVIIAGALLPFFCHNVFGLKSKMFIGDSGTLMLGTAFATFVFCVLSKDSPCKALEDNGVGLIAFSLAVFAIPVFDTLRVMSVRIVRGRSPFHPDKTHLHHLFIEMGFSHVGTAATIIAMDVLIVLVWLLSWILGASIDWQTYIVLALGFLCTFGLYLFMRVQQKKGALDEYGFPEGSKVWKAMQRLGEKSHIERTGLWKGMRDLMDKNK